MPDALLIPLGVLIGIIVIATILGWAVFAERRHKPGKSWFAPPSGDQDIGGGPPGMS